MTGNTEVTLSAANPACRFMRQVLGKLQTPGAHLLPLLAPGVAEVLAHVCLYLLMHLEPRARGNARDEDVKREGVSIRPISAHDPFRIIRLWRKKENHPVDSGLILNGELPLARARRIASIHGR